MNWNRYIPDHAATTVPVLAMLVALHFWVSRDAPVEPGDYILNHVGFAIRRIPPEDAAETLALYDELLRLADEQDLMAADVRGEISAAPDAPRSPKGATDAAK